MGAWNMVISQGATYQATITMAGVADIATATEWRLVMSMPNAAAFATATIANGGFQAGINSAQKILVLTAADTANYPLGNGRYDFEILWTGGVVRRYISNGYLQVNPKVGT